MSRFQRRGGAAEAQRATTLELFYDLVFVFAITQVSHLLLAHLTWDGAGQSALPSKELIAVVAGPALYLFAQAVLRLRMTGRVSTRRVAGVLACVLVGLIGTDAPALAVGALLLAVLVAVIVADQIAGSRRTAGGLPTH